jgi:cytochrome d ubiquinol oxidase subunit I
LLAYRDINATVKGIKDLIEEYNLKKEELPSVPLVFWSFRGMVGLGFLFVFISILLIVLYYRRKLLQSRWFLWLLVFTPPLPIIANWLGWIVTEVGRQPWVIYGLMKTREGVSRITTSEVAFTLFFFISIYAILLILWLFLTFREISKDVK